MQPTFIQKIETIFNTSITPKTTGTFNVLQGDVLIAYCVVENYGPKTPNPPIISDSSGTLIWTLQQSILVTDYCQLLTWSSIIDTDKSMTVSFSIIQGTYLADFGGSVLVFRESNGIGSSSKTNMLSGAPTLDITTSQDNSAIVVISTDWNAADGASKIWLSNAGIFNETTYNYITDVYTIYSGYHNDAGTTGLKTVGLQSPAAQKYSIAAIEVKGLTTPTCPPLTCNLLLT